MLLEPTCLLTDQAANAQRSFVSQAHPQMAHAWPQATGLETARSVGSHASPPAPPQPQQGGSGNEDISAALQGGCKWSRSCMEQRRNCAAVVLQTDWETQIIRLWVQSVSTPDSTPITLAPACGEPTGLVCALSSPQILRLSTGVQHLL